MIQLLRIDERLIHGQVANQWARTLGFEAIVVANDAAVNNPITKSSLKMAAPGNCKVVIKSVDEAIELLNDPRCEKLKIFITCNCPKDALRLIKGVPSIPYLNIRNFGRVGYQTTNRKKYHETFFANEEEVETLKEILAIGIDCECRMLVDDPKVSLASVLK